MLNQMGKTCASLRRTRPPYHCFCMLNYVFTRSHNHSGGTAASPNTRTKTRHRLTFSAADDSHDTQQEQQQQQPHQPRQHSSPELLHPLISPPDSQEDSSSHQQPDEISTHPFASTFSSLLHDAPLPPLSTSLSSPPPHTEALTGACFECELSQTICVHVSAPLLHLTGVYIRCLCSCLVCCCCIDARSNHY